MRVKHIQAFLFDEAQYRIQDKDGDEILLIVDYKNNKFAIKKLSLINNKQFQKEITKIAKDLLKRKHNINFAER